MKIGLIGGGPSNLFLAWLLRNEADLYLIEEDNRLGLPMHCTGLVSERMAVTLGLGWRVIDNYYSSLTITNSLNSRGVLLKFTGNRIVMLNRPGLEEHLYSKASFRGVHMGVRVTEVNKRGVVRGFGGFEGSYDVVVIGEGARNVLSRITLGTRLNTVSGVQADGYSQYLKGVVNDEHHIVVLFGGHYSGRFFAWIVPRGDGEFRVGVVDDPRIVGLRFRKIIGELRLNPRRVFGGRVVLGASNVNYGQGSVAAVGDSTGITKSLTGGGIVTGMLTSLILARALHEHWGVGDPIAEYSRALGGTLGRLARAYSALSNMLYGNVTVVEGALGEFDGIEVSIPDYDNHMDALIRLLMARPKLGLTLVKYTPSLNISTVNLRDLVTALF
ncbi:MAG: NAD(P)/FAD-dependent oxidoreductase [Caldivirga sp.]|nr:NAD(P)/FAD-dependent oxidoreductase [Caldivirga sp.]